MLLSAVQLAGVLSLVRMSSAVRFDSELSVISHAAAQHLHPPEYPVAYKASYTFQLPSTVNFLPEPITYPAELWINRKHNMLRLTTYDGLDTEIDRDGHVYMITPRVDKKVCRIDGDLPGETHTETAGPRLSSEGGRPAGPTTSALQTGLPPMSEWTFKAERDWDGQKAYEWNWEHKDELKVSHYKMIVTPKGVPLQLSMLGSELFSGAHFDEYVANFTSFESMDVDDLSPFEVPDLCKGRDVERGPRTMSLWHASLIPMVHHTRNEYDDFASKHNRVHTDHADYQQRAAWYQYHHAMVHTHNAKADRSHTLGLNRFADWTNDEYKRMLGFKRSPEVAAAIETLQTGEKLSTDAQGALSRRSKFDHKAHWRPLPASLDWRGSGAVGVVKDQAVCGSCWTFSASQAIAASWFMATGEPAPSLSEQQILDCSWEYGTNEACDGGDPDLGVQYIIDAGGILSERDYPYKGEDGYCKIGKGDELAGAKPAAYVKELFYIERYNQEAVQQALMKYGPLSIAVNANPNPFRFYTGGVLDADNCGGKPWDLDHAILLVGWGEENGKPYWIVKNQWSPWWGHHGYMKISRDNDCGVTTEAFFIKADPEKGAGQALPATL